MTAPAMPTGLFIKIDSSCSGGLRRGRHASYGDVFRLLFGLRGHRHTLLELDSRVKDDIDDVNRIIDENKRQGKE